jgi:hypothetical protein
MDQLKQAKNGRSVPEEEIPPAVSASAAVSRPAAPLPAESAEGVMPPSPQGLSYPLDQENLN